MIEQVHEDWNKGTYEFLLTKKAFQASEDLNDAKKYPVIRYSNRAISSVSTYLNILIGGGKKENKEKIEGLQQKLERLYLLLNKGLIQLKIKHNKSVYFLKWIETKSPYYSNELLNKQVIPLIVGDIFMEAMEITQSLGYFIQKPIEKKTGIGGYAEASGVSIDIDEDD